METFDLTPFVTDETRRFLGRRIFNPKVHALLEAGMKLLIEGVRGGIESPFKFPSIDAVCATAAKSPPFRVVSTVTTRDDFARGLGQGRIITAAFRAADNAFHKSWPRQENFRADLAMYTLTKPSWFAGDEIGQIALKQLISSPESIDSVLEELACEDLRLFEDSLFRVQLVMQAMAPDESIMRDAIDRMYDNIDRTWIAAYQGLLSHYSVRLRRDISEFDIAHILTAVAEGIGLRRLVQFDDRSIYDATRKRSVLGKAALALFAASVCPEGDTRTVAELFRDALQGGSPG